MRSDQTLETDTERNREVKDNAKVFSLSGYQGRAGSVEELILEGREGSGGTRSSWMYAAQGRHLG